MAKIQLENPTAIPELDAALAGLTKAFGIDMSGDDYGNIVPFTTGSLKVDIWTRRGGIPTGRIIEVFGFEKSMKTTFCLLCLAARQRWRKEQGITNKRDLLIDLEHSLERQWMEALGVDFDQIIWKRPPNVEIALEMCIALGKTGTIDYVLFDSVDAGLNERQLRRTVGESDVGGISKDMSFALRKLTRIAPTTGTTYLFINQLRMNPGVMFGSPKTTPGGNALKFYASFRIEMLSRQDSKDITGASVMRLRGVKTKMSSDIDWPDCEVAVIPGVGYSETYEINSLGTSWSIIRHSGGQTKAWWGGPDSEPEPIHPDVGKGKAAGIELIDTYEPVRVRLKNAILRAGKIDGALSDQEVLALYPDAFTPGSLAPESDIIEEETDGSVEAATAS